MTTSGEQLREEFEAWYTTQYTSYIPRSGYGYSNLDTELAWQACLVGRAALQHSCKEPSQDREDAERFRFCLEHGFPQKWKERIKGNFRQYWTSRPGSQEEFSSAIEAIDHARRIEGGK